MERVGLLNAKSPPTGGVDGLSPVGGSVRLPPVGSEPTGNYGPNGKPTPANSSHARFLTSISNSSPSSLTLVTPMS